MGKRDDKKILFCREERVTTQKNQFSAAEVSKISRSEAQYKNSETNARIQYEILCWRVTSGVHSAFSWRHDPICICVICLHREACGRAQDPVYALQPPNWKASIE